MASKLTPKQEKVMVEELRKDYEDAKKRIDKEGLPIGEALGKDVRPTFDALFAFYPPNIKETYDKIAQTFDEDLARKTLNKYVSLGEKTKGEPKKSKEAFQIFETPETYQEGVRAYDFDMRDKGGPDEDSNSILKKMNAAEREKIFKKLGVPVRWDSKEKKLVGIYEPKRRFYNYRLDTENFLAQANKLLKRPEEKGLVDQTKKDEFIKNLIAVITEKYNAEDEYRNDEESWPETWGDYCEEDARHKDWNELIRHLSSEVEKYVEELEKFGLSHSEITDMLIENAEQEGHNSYYYQDNEIGRSSVPSEETMEVYEPNDWVDDPKFPFPGDWDANLALLEDEDIKKIKDELDFHTDWSWDEAEQTWELGDMTISVGDQACVILVVQPTQFISAAKRKIKDAKLERRGRKREVETASYPTVAKVVGEPYPTVRAILEDE